MATGDEHLEEAAGTVNGVNDSFTTSQNYQAGTLRVLWDGKLTDDDGDNFGWMETGANSFQTATPPVIGDRIYCRYVEA